MASAHLLFLSCGSRVSDSENGIWRNRNVKSNSLILDEAIEYILPFINKAEVKRTPLVYMKTLSELSKKQVYLKDDSAQTCGSFKIRGVLAEVDESVALRAYNMLESKDLCRKPYYLVTQTSGNHGAAIIEATRASIERYRIMLSWDPDVVEGLNRIEPIIFASQNAASVKIANMEKMLQLYRQYVGDEARGRIDTTSKNYTEARDAREKFTIEHPDDSLYMPHGGIEIMAGYAWGGLEIGEQLEEKGIGPEKVVTLIVPVAVGGPVGICGGFKGRVRNSRTLIVQTKPYSAFIRTLQTGVNQYNDASPPPTTFIKGNPIVFEDGIAVDTGEPDAISIAGEIVDEAMIVDAHKNLYRAAPIVYRDLAKIVGEDNAEVGGTTSATAEALLEHLENNNSQSIREADVIVLYGTEGNVNPDITEFIKNLAAAAK